MDENLEKLKEFLNSIWKAQDLANTLYESAERMEAEAYNLKSVQLGDKVQSSHQSDLSDIVVRLEDSRNALHDAMFMWMELWDEGEELISHETDLTLQNLLWKRYMQGGKWEDIAESLGFSVDHVFRLHRKALMDVIPYFHPKDDSKCQ